MQEHPVLGQLALGYSPLIDPQRKVHALRLTVFPERPDVVPDVAGLLAVLQSVWPAPESAATPPRLSLNLANESLLHGLMTAGSAAQLMLEVPAFMAADPARLDTFRQLKAAGRVLTLKGRPLAPLPAELLACFEHCILEAGEDRRELMPRAGQGRKLSCIQGGIRCTADLDAAFKEGAALCVGWPWDDAQPAASSRSAVPSDIGTVMDLINGVDREEPVAKLEPVLRRDPTLAFRLMRYLNSPAFGLPVEVNSFSHALMLLGYNRLKRWLALLLVSSAKGPNSQVLVFAAVRRGLLMEELGRELCDAETRGELFICGVFSLLHRLMQQPMVELLRAVPVPDSVNKALLGEGGPYGPYLELVRAIELEAVFDIREKTEQLMLGPGAVNRAILTALRSASELET